MLVSYIYFHILWSFHAGGVPTSINKWVNNGWAVFDMSVYLRLLSPSTWNLYVAFDNGIYLKLENKKWAASWQNQQNGMCAQRRLGWIWASARSDQESLLSAWRKLGSLATHWVHSEDSLSLPWVHSHFIGFVMRQLKSKLHFILCVNDKHMTTVMILSFRTPQKCVVITLKFELCGFTIE